MFDWLMGESWIYRGNPPRCNMQNIQRNALIQCGALKTFPVMNDNGDYLGGKIV
jgi:hypothetical protein